MKVNGLKPAHSCPSNSSTRMGLLKASTSPPMPLVHSLNPKYLCSSPEWQCWCQLLLLSSSEPALTPNLPGSPWVCQEFCWNTNKWKTGDISPACYVSSTYGMWALPMLRSNKETSSEYSHISHSTSSETARYWNSKRFTVSPGFLNPRAHITLSIP